MDARKRAWGAVVLASGMWGCGLDGPGPDGGSAGSIGQGAGGPGSGGGAANGSGAGPSGPCTPVAIDPTAVRPVALFSQAELTDLAAVMPCVADEELAAQLESDDAMFYDKSHIAPGYQDSYGDGFNFPVGMRPNTIESNLIDLAVPGGHAQIFIERGVFHFPFGRPIDVADDHGRVVDFWLLPREAGALLPVVWSWWEPSNWTHRIEWMFPVGTVFGELLFIIDADGAAYPFEIRTRTRELDRWAVDALRPFPTAVELADALEHKRTERPEWESSSEIDALVAHLRDPATLEAGALDASHFGSAFPDIEGAIDVLPALADNSILIELLRATPFRSARDTVWKESGGLRSYAPTSAARMSIVPQGYNGGFVAVDEESCETCHRDAGRPFKDFYSNILAYGELWGEDDTFSWHPFDNASFVDGQGDVVSFNDDNRVFRSDFAPVLAEYEPSAHDGSRYAKIARSWKNYVHQ